MPTAFARCLSKRQFIESAQELPEFGHLVGSYFLSQARKSPYGGPSASEYNVPSLAWKRRSLQLQDMGNSLCSQHLMILFVCKPFNAGILVALHVKPVDQV